MTRVTITALAIIAALFTTSAEARKIHRSSIAPDAGCELTDSARTICGPAAYAGSRRATTRAERAFARSETVTIAADEGSSLGTRPEGCPRAYCGCGLRKYLGLEDERLNLASAWLRFPRVPGPAAGVAAVRSGHVMYIESSAADGQWLVRDYNSGGGLSRLHVRDVRGYVFVNPRAG